MMTDANTNAGTAASAAGKVYEAGVAARLSKFTTYDRTESARTIQLPRPALTYDDQSIIADGWMPELRTYVEVKGGGEETLGSAYQKWYYQFHLIDEGVYLRALDGGLYGAAGDAPCGFLLVLAGTAADMNHSHRFFAAWSRHSALYRREYRYAWCVREQEINHTLLQHIKMTVSRGYGGVSDV